MDQLRWNLNLDLLKWKRYESDCYLTKKYPAAKRFIKKALTSTHIQSPVVITVDKTQHTLSQFSKYRTKWLSQDRNPEMHYPLNPKFNPIRLLQGSEKGDSGFKTDLQSDNRRGCAAGTGPF
jgi:hypothetical protein